MLKVWIPGTTDTRDQGLGGTEFVNDNVTIVTNGKLGSCLSFNGSNSRLSTTGFSLSNKWSFSVWIKCNSASSSWMEIWSLGDNNDANRAAAFVVNPSGPRIQVSINGIYNSMLTMKTPTEWNHYAGSWDGSHFVYYINGVYINTYTYTTTYLAKSNLTIGAISTSESGGGHTSIRLPFNGLMNDLRIWDDEVISPREIKEISKGLVLHYPLSGVGKENLVDTTKTFPVGGTGRMQNIENGVKTLGVDADTYFNIPLKTALASGTTYTLSFHATNIPSGSRLAFGLGAQSTSHASHCGIVDVHGGYNTFTFIPGANFSTQIIMDDIYRTGLPVVEMTYFKIEEGDAATPWTPSLNDSRYPAVGSDANIVYDVSGYGYNGKSLGTLSCSGDTPRYTMSTNFNGADNGILIENLQLSDIINTSVTYSFWIKPSGENGARSVYFGSYSGTSWSIEKTAGNIIRGYWNGSPDVGYSGATITDGIWQHVCITKNGTSDIKVYINGVLKATSTATHSALTFPTTYRIGRDTRSSDGTPYKGLMSDFRIYATALSADDVLELYHTPITLSSNGTLLTQGEYVEV